MPFFKKPVEEVVDLTRRKMFTLPEPSPNTNLPAVISPQESDDLANKVVSKVLEAPVDRRSFLEGTRNAAISTMTPSPLKILGKVIPGPSEPRRVLDTMLPWQKNLAEALHFADLELPNYFNKDYVFNRAEKLWDNYGPETLEEAEDLYQREGLYIPEAEEVIDDLIYDLENQTDPEIIDSLRSQVEGMGNLSDEEILSFVKDLKSPEKYKVFDELSEEGKESASDYFYNEFYGGYDE